MKRYVALADFGFPGPKTFKLGGFPNEGYSRNASFSLNSISTFTGEMLVTGEYHQLSPTKCITL
jgi:DsbC/DsbD-like thiol-disulfide interchange protein